MLPIEPFAWVVALMPLIGYLFVIGAIRYSGRALVTTGAREVAALAVAVCGFIAVGPAELLFPTTAAIVFGPIVWLALIVFYGLITTLIAITRDPFLVVQGRTPHETYPALLRAAKQLDSLAEADEDQLQVFLPRLNVRLRVDGIPNIDYCRIVSFAPDCSIKFWGALLGLVRGEIHNETKSVGRRGVGMLIAVAVLFLLLVRQAFSRHDQLIEGFRDWLWR